MDLVPALAWVWNHILTTSLFSGAVVAFVLWSRTRPGKLVLTLDPPERGKVRPAPNGRIYRHVIVSNTRRAHPAHNVRVVVEELAEFTNGKAHVLFNTHLFLEYQWEANDREKKKPPRERTVGEKMSWDLCSIGRDTQTVHIHVADASWNWDPPELKAKKIYRLALRATSNEVTSARLYVSIEWDGEWNDDNEVSATRHLKVREMMTR
jgi:hypothetical protein